MALKFRRGTTAQKSGSLAFGEPYVNTTLGTLQIGLESSDVTLSAIGTGSNLVVASVSAEILATNGVISGSSQLTTELDERYLNTSGDGIISSSVQVTLSSTTGYSTFSSSLDNRILTEKGRVDAILTASDADKDSFAEIVTLINSVDTTNDTTFASFYTSSINRINNIETFSSSTLTRLTDLEGTDIGITLTGDVTGTGTITNLGDVSFETTISTNSVALGTDTTGNYVASLVAGTGVTITNNSGENATPTIAIGQSVATNATPTFGNLTINGTITSTGDITAYYTSDKRHKNNIQPITNALSKVSKLNGVTWEWNDDVNEVTKSTPKTGLIAQEVQEVLPEVVVERENGFLGLDYSKMMGLMVEAIKEQQTHIHKLTLEIENLKKNNSL